MSAPRFETRAEFEDWESDEMRSLVNRARNKRVRRSSVREQASLIDRVAKAHAHLLTPESDNG